MSLPAEGNIVAIGENAWTRVACAVDLRHVDAAEAVRAFQQRGLKPSTATRMVGYAAFLRQVGWDGLANLMDGESLTMLRSGFEDAGVDPFGIEFPEGDTLFLDELRRSSYHPKVRDAVEARRPEN